MLDLESLLNSTFGQTCTHAHPTEHSTSCKGINDKCEIPAHSGVFWCFSVFSYCSEFCPLGSVVAWVIAEDRVQLGLIISSGFRQLHMSTSVGSFVLSHLQSGCHIPWEGWIRAVEPTPTRISIFEFCFTLFFLHQECLVFPHFLYPVLGCPLSL